MQIRFQQSHIAQDAFSNTRRKEQGIPKLTTFLTSNALDGQNATPQHHQGSCRYPSGILVSNVICQG